MKNQKQLVMDIAMNLNRIGNWIADDFGKNYKKIKVFVENNDEYIEQFKCTNDHFGKTWSNFLLVYPSFKSDLKNNAENLMTWGNILTHRSKFLD